MEFDIKVVNESSSSHELMMELQRTRDTLRNLLELTTWMTGSSDFLPEGKAYRGWLRMRGNEIMMKARNILDD